MCHEVTEQVATSLEHDPVDLLVSYHPLLFEPSTSLVSGRSPADRVFRLIRAGVALVTVHTAFDVVAGGAADALADAIGLHNSQDLPADANSHLDPAVGAVGPVGRLIDPMPIVDLGNLVGEALGGTARVTRGGADPARTVAVIPGSGASYLAVAASVADAVVTGDVGHHKAREAADRGLTVIDPGHACTERPGVARLYAAVAALGACRDLTAMDASPWEEPA